MEVFIFARFHARPGHEGAVEESTPRCGGAVS